MRAGLCLAALLIATAASAQTPAPPPGPYVIDLRGAMSGAPDGSSFYPAVPKDTIAPQRAFGFGAGAHVYFGRLGVARLGAGADVMRMRGTAASVGKIGAQMDVTTVAPQVSFNFGTRDGWSYLSAGYGMTQTRTEVVVPATLTDPTTLLSLERRSNTANFGGGARWFLRERLAVGFDVRFHRLAATGELGAKQIVGLAVGVSVR